MPAVIIISGGHGGEEKYHEGPQPGSEEWEGRDQSRTNLGAQMRQRLGMDLDEARLDRTMRRYERRGRGGRFRRT